jgi:pyruvate carboxylase subunit B
VDGDSYEVDWRRVDDSVYSLLIDGRSHTALVARRDGGLTVSVGGRRFELAMGRGEEESTGFAAGSVATGGSIRAPMPGTVVKVLVSEGDVVTANQGLVIVEAMKMENEVRSPVDGVVTAVSVAAGDSVDTSLAMVEIEPLAGHEEAGSEE